MVKSKKILITGGTGFIGSWLIEKFIKENQITVFDNGRRNSFQYLPKEIQQEVTLIKGDIQDPQALKLAVKGQDIILHLAAIAGASFYEKDPLLTLSVNLFGTHNLLDLVMKANPEQVILFSSSEVYGPAAHFVSEESNTCIGPISQGRWSYAVSKVASDHLAMAYYKKYNLPINIVRPFNVYGPRQIGEGAVGNMCKDALKLKKITVTGDGSQKRAWCFVEDFVEMINLIIEKKIKGECFNLGNSLDYLSIIELAGKIASISKVKHIELTDRVNGEIIDRIPQMSKVETMLGYKPQISINQGLERSFEWYKENINNV